MAWGDWDGDGDLDLAVGNANNQPNRVYANTGGALAATAAWSSTETDDTTSVAWGDWDSDGDLDLAVGNWGANRVYANGRNFIPSGLPESPVLPVTLDRPGTTDGAFFFSSAERLVSPVTVPYTLCDAEGDTAWKIVPEYSLRGGGRWLAATAGAGGDGTTGLSASPAGEAHTFVWDSAADGAHSDNAVFRISVEWQAPDHAGYPIQRPRVSSVTPPFRVVACIEGVTAGGPTTFCEGESVQLSAAPEAGTGPFTYLWSPGNATTQAVTVTEAGTYSCEVTDTASGCGNTVTTNAVAVTVHPNPGAPTEIVWMLPKGDKSGFTWANMTGADYYRVVRATPAGLASYDFTTCVGYGITDGAAGADITGDVPAEGTCHYYIVQGYACIDPDENLSPAGDGVLERTLTATTCDGD